MCCWCGVTLQCRQTTLVGVFSMQQISLALSPSSFPECSMEVSPVREGGGERERERERGRGCGYVCKLETPPGERESHYGKHSSQAKEASLGRMAISAHPC